MRTPGPSRSPHVQTSTAGRTKSPPLTLRHLTRQPLALAIAPTHTLGVHDLRKETLDVTREQKVRYLFITPKGVKREQKLAAPLTQTPTPIPTPIPSLSLSLTPTLP